MAWQCIGTESPLRFAYFLQILYKNDCNLLIFMVYYIYIQS